MEDAELSRYGRNIALLARAVEAALGDLSLTGYRLMSLVAQGDERSSQIAGRLSIARPTVTYAVDALVEKGLLTRGTVEGDRRVVKLTLTRSGRAALRRAETAIAERLRPVFERLDDPQAALLSMEAVQAALAADWAERVRKRRARK